MSKSGSLAGRQLSPIFELTQLNYQITVIEIIDLKQEKQETCRFMICQLDSNEYDWTKSKGLYFLNHNEKIINKVKEFLKIAKHNSVDLVLFPELSIPEKLIEKIQEWSKEQESIVICGSHYYNNNEKLISRSPIIVRGNVYFTEKFIPSPLEKSPIDGEGIYPGNKLLKFINSFIGSFSVLICSDYLEESLKQELDLQSLDILCVPSFQKDSEIYYRRMNIDCENSNNGIYLLYSNFKDKKYGDGNSAIFGLMDNLFTQKLNEAGFTDLNPNKKVVQFKTDTEYLIGDINLNIKRPFANRNVNTEPNFKVIATNNQTKSKDLTFIQKVAHDDERYKRIDELFVPPLEYDEILKMLEKNNILFIVGDPGIGKTYTAAKILKIYFERGYDPIWFAGLEKEEREVQSRVLSDFSPSDMQIVYFEDPFGRTAFERRDSLFQVFSPLLDKLSNLKSKIIITSRIEIFETFSKESLLEAEILKLKTELNIRNPSYNSDKLCTIFDRIASLTCEWYDKLDFRELVYSAINSNKITTPLAIRDLVFVSRNTKTTTELKEYIERRTTETTKVFALEILVASVTKKAILFLIYFCGNKGKPFLSELFKSVGKELAKINIQLDSFSFNMEIRSQLGFRIEQFGSIKSAYKFSHPIYEEALSSLIRSNYQCELIAKVIIQELAKLDTKTTYLILNKYVVKYPEVSLLLFRHILDQNTLLKENSVRLSICQKLISTYNNTKNEEFFELVCKFYSLPDLINDINNDFISWENLSHKLNLCQRYISNSPIEFDSSLTDKINWDKLFSIKSDDYFSPTRLLHFLASCALINSTSISLFIDKKGANLLKTTYFILDLSNRKRLFKLLKGHSLQKELRRYKTLLDNIKKSGDISKRSILRKTLFSDSRFYGKVIIDLGAQKALIRPWINLLPAGIINVVGKFAASSIIGIFNEANSCIGVGVTEYSSDELKLIKGHSSSEFQELIGYYHTSCAVKADLLLKSKWMELDKWTYIENP